MKTLSTHTLDDNVKDKDDNSIEGFYEDLQSPEVFEPVNPDKGAQELLLIKPPEQPENPRCVRVAIIGTPNAGKSTLVNTLLGRRICAVSKKVHTTRRQATAVLTEGDTQVIILDTPGMVTKESARRHSLPRELIVSPKSSLELADLIIVIIDVADKWTCKKISTDILMELNNHQETPCILVLNKVDIVKDKQSLIELTALLTNGVVEGKPIEMSGRLTKKLLRNKGFRSKYLYYKGLSTGTGENKSEDGTLESVREGVVTSGSDETGRLMSVQGLYTVGDADKNNREDDTLVSVRGVGTASSDETDRLLSVEDEPSEITSDKYTSPLGSLTISEEAPHSTADIQIDSEELSEDDIDIPDEGYSDGDKLSTYLQNDELKMNTEMAKLLKEYVNNLNSVSRIHRSKEKVNIEEKNQQLEANRKRQELFREFNESSGWHLFEKVFMVSALSGDGVKELKKFVMDSAKPEEWEYHKKVVTDLSPLEIVEEAIREQLLESLPQEIPYNIHQQNSYWEYDDNGTLLINQKLICFKKTHYKSLLRKIRTIARCSEEDLMNAFHCDIMLKLSVKLFK